ncbi:MAG: extensin family protein [Rhodobacteraceae bacterium]|nr:extensin family protein [Paracoccaceae bacterium]
MKLVLTLLLAFGLTSCDRYPGADSTLSSGEFLDLVELCGNPNLLGTKIGDVDGPNSCGIRDAVSVQYVSGVRLSTAARLNCRTANTLANWVARDAQSAVRKLRSRITEMTVLASYSCRTRNNQRGARMSEHSLGNAIDIGAFTLADGTVLSVEQDWGKGRSGAALARLHTAACGPFGTVLGPRSDRFHYNHFHFDTAGYRSGAYCR